MSGVRCQVSGVIKGRSISLDIYSVFCVLRDSNSTKYGVLKKIEASFDVDSWSEKRMEALRMESLNKYISEYKKQMGKGDIRKAYQGLMEYMMNLRLDLKSKYPEYSVSGSLYLGYMDMTYFAFTPEFLREKKLKIALVFIHEKVQFEVWLSGSNKQIQRKYWELFKDRDLGNYRMPSSIEGVDFIVEGTLVDNPDFDDLDALTEQIESGILGFIGEVQDILDLNGECLTY